MVERYQTFAEFWPYYVSEHSRRGTRILHFCGTLLLLPVLLMALFSSPWYFLLLPLVGYGFAWISHAAVERNKPATFDYPLWSLLADFKMFALMCAGKMKGEVDKYGRESEGGEQSRER